MPAPQRAHTSGSRASPSSRSSRLGDKIYGPRFTKFSAPDAARVEARVPSPAHRRMEEFRSAVARGFQTSHRSGKRKGVRAKRPRWRHSLREKLVIFRLSSSQSNSSSSTSALSSKPSLSNTSNMDASSNNDRRVIFRNWMNSCLCTLPDPSAILLEIDRPAARSCSAYR